MRVINNQHSTGSGSGVNGISFDELKVAFIGELTQENVQTALDQLSVTIPVNMGVFLLFTHYVEGDSGPITVAKYLFKNNQATTVFNPGNPIQYEDLIYIGSVTGAEVIQFGTTQVIELGEIANTDVSVFVNAHGPYAVQDSTKRYVVFRSTRAGVEVLYLFLNEGGVYGNGATQTTEDDYAPFDTNTGAVIPSLGQILNVSNRQVKILPAGLYFLEAEDKTKTLTAQYTDCVVQLNKDVFNVGDELEIVNMFGYDLEITNDGYSQIVFDSERGTDRIFIPKGATAVLKFIYKIAIYSNWSMSFRASKKVPKRYEGLIWSNDPATFTDGELVIGQTYTITNYVAGDDFTNVGAVANANGVIFGATGTTPANWTNESVLDYDGRPGAIRLSNSLGFQPNFQFEGFGLYVDYNPLYVAGKTTCQIQSRPGIIDTAECYEGAISLESYNFYFAQNISNASPTKITIEIYP